MTTSFNLGKVWILPRGIFYKISERGGGGWLPVELARQRIKKAPALRYFIYKLIDEAFPVRNGAFNSRWCYWVFTEIILLKFACRRVCYRSPNCCSNCLREYFSILQPRRVNLYMSSWEIESNSVASSETQGQLVGARRSKSSKLGATKVYNSGTLISPDLFRLTPSGMLCHETVLSQNCTVTAQNTVIDRGKNKFGFWNDRELWRQRHQI